MAGTPDDMAPHVREKWILAVLDLQQRGLLDREMVEAAYDCVEQFGRVRGRLEAIQVVADTGSIRKAIDAMSAINDLEQELEDALEGLEGL